MRTPVSFAAAAGKQAHSVQFPIFILLTTSILCDFYDVSGSQDAAAEESTQAQTPSVSKKPRGAEKAKETQGEPSRQKMPLAEARKAAREEVEKRTQERVNALAARKKD